MRVSLYLLLIFCFTFCTRIKNNSNIKVLSYQNLDLDFLTGIDSSKLTKGIYKVEYYSKNKTQNKDFEMFAWSEYDSFGRITKSYLCPPYHNNSDYYYYKNNLIKKIVYNQEDTFKAQYYFDSLKNILYRYWSGAALDTNIYYFSEKGKIIKSLGPAQIQNGGMFAWDELIYFYYSKNNRLVKTKSILLNEKSDTSNVDSSYNSIKTNRYYYYKNKLDSMVSVTQFNSGKKVVRITRYDSLGNSIEVNKKDEIVFKRIELKRG